MAALSPDGYINPGTEFDFALLQNNDEQLVFSISNGQVPLSLTGYTLAFYLKASAAQGDATAYTNTPSITSSFLGQFTVTIPRAQLTTATLPGTPLFYHVDGTITGLTSTLVFGNIAVLAI
jgi:hypothetical protein